MRKLLLAAFVAVAAAQTAPGAYAACAETHGSTAHVHSTKCNPSQDCLVDCPSLPLCLLVPDIHTTIGVNVECD